MRCIHRIARFSSNGHSGSSLPSDTLLKLQKEQPTHTNKLYKQALHNKCWWQQNFPCSPLKVPTMASSLLFQNNGNITAAIVLPLSGELSPFVHTTKPQNSTVKGILKQQKNHQNQPRPMFGQCTSVC